jgi:hypothetical protein
MNIILILVAILCGILFDSHRKEIQEYVAQEADGAQLTTLNDLSLDPAHLGGAKILVANRPDVEFPLKILPRHIISCGPMIRPAKPVIDVDPELAVWLRRGPTLYINLGTHAAFDETFAFEMATALRILLDHARSIQWRDKKLAGLQVLWKLRRKGDYSVTETRSRVHHVLGREMDKGLVRIVEWIDAEPTAVLAEKSVICAVHHGGANSFLETVR